ncbi:hypothetical protein GCM10007874_26620 [Labrys miyagiensis]|uniref:Uncharacterized protein n=1 Tax=Labrys miyagiensis TaxID=346912 RepID=A0ABQ6CL96_9HYPH|nr:hypothetical protein GCM10007874_26620 [Labrys miyagiensis]
MIDLGLYSIIFDCHLNPKLFNLVVIKINGLSYSKWVTRANCLHADPFRLCYIV